MTGISYETWRGLQIAYETDMNAINEAKALKLENSDLVSEGKIASAIDGSFCKKLGVFPKGRLTTLKKVKKLKQFFMFSDLSMLNSFNSAVSYRNEKKSF